MNIRTFMLAAAALFLLLLVVTACTVVRVTTFYARCSGDGKGCTYRHPSHSFHSPEPTLRILSLRLPTGPVYLCQWATCPGYDGTLTAPETRQRPRRITYDPPPHVGPPVFANCSISRVRMYDDLGKMQREWPMFEINSCRRQVSKIPWTYQLAPRFSPVGPGAPGHVAYEEYQFGIR